MAELATDRWFCPASFAQEGMWLASQLDPAAAAYHLRCVIDVPAGIGAQEVTAALAVVVDRHEALRTSLEIRDGALVQAVRTALPVTLSRSDLRASVPPEQQQREIERLCHTDATTPFRLHEAPLWRGRLIHHTGGLRFFFIAHHAIFDAASVLLLVDELDEQWRATLAGEPAQLPELGIQPADHAAWQRDQATGAAFAAGMAYWRERLVGCPPLLGLPTDRPRPTAPNRAGDEVLFPFPPGTRAAATALGRQGRATGVMVLLAAYVALLSRRSGQTDLAVGVPVSGRERPELLPVIGIFINTVVVRVDLSGNPAFRDVISRVRQSMLEAWEHQDIPVSHLVRVLATQRDPRVHPLFQVGFNDLGDVPVSRSYGAARDELLLELSEQEGRLEYRTDLFDAATARQITREYVCLLGAALDNPDLRLSDLPLLSPDEHHALVMEANATAAPPREQLDRP